MEGGGSSNWYIDNDLDGYGDPMIVVSAEECPSGHVSNNLDCNDTDASINPDAAEIFDDIDNNCDGGIDNVPYWYADTDTDGYGDPELSLQEPLQPNGYVLDNTDCDDTDGTINPGTPEIDGDDIDNNCDGSVDIIIYAIGDTGPAGGIVFYVDETGLQIMEAAPVDQDALGAEWGCDGLNIPGASGTAIGTGAQNTADILAACSQTGIAAELASNYSLNGYDDWFLPSKDEVFAMYHNLSGIVSWQSPGYWSSSEDNAVFIPEIAAWSMDSVGTACNFYGPPTCVDSQMPMSKVSALRVRAVRAFNMVPYWYADTDMDGYGDPSAALVQHTSQPDGYVANNADCDSANADINPGAIEIADSR